MKVPAKSIIIGRMPRVGDNEFKTLFVKVYEEANPQVATDFPKEELTFENTEKAIFENCIPEYYLEGNDLIVNEISEVEIIQEGNSVKIICN